MRQGARTFVDDIRLEVKGPFKLAAGLARAFFYVVARDLREGDAELQGKKCAAMASKPRLRLLLRKALEGTEVSTPLHARDLGVDAAPGIRRLPIQQKRLAKGGARADRLRAARLKGKRAVTQVNFLVLSTELYGVEATGMSSSATRKK